VKRYNDTGIWHQFIVANLPTTVDRIARAVNHMYLSKEITDDVTASVHGESILPKYFTPCTDRQDINAYASDNVSVDLACVFAVKNLLIKRHRTLSASTKTANNNKTNKHFMALFFQ